MSPGPQIAAAILRTLQAWQRQRLLPSGHPRDAGAMGSPRDSDAPGALTVVLKGSQGGRRSQGISQDIGAQRPSHGLHNPRGSSSGAPRRNTRDSGAPRGLLDVLAPPRALPGMGPSQTVALVGAAALSRPSQGRRRPRGSLLAAGPQGFSRPQAPQALSQESGAPRGPPRDSAPSGLPATVAPREPAIVAPPGPSQVLRCFLGPARALPPQRLSQGQRCPGALPQANTKKAALPGALSVALRLRGALPRPSGGPQGSSRKRDAQALSVGWHQGQCQGLRRTQRPSQGRRQPQRISEGQGAPRAIQGYRHPQGLNQGQSLSMGHVVDSRVPRAL
ncbi:translation initiation factor IF-2-like [Homarus americanus]|uniref:translation initiation factor IF-2-like n=1 Tax=Homarus americanus TaxID=6706 RepID=UPI001C44DC2B|nr:translation initiation factor IF-2-like [Homarus americanus]